MNDGILTSVYGGSGIDYFYAVTTDINDNIICAGVTSSGGVGSAIALVVKFDSNLNVLTRKVYGGSGADYFYGVTTDASGNIICAGYSISEGVGNWDALVVKFDSSLNVLARKVYGGSGEDCFVAVTTDASDNIICAGYTYSESAGSADALVVKFDSGLNILTRKRYGGSSSDYFYAVTTDASGNIICAGLTNSESRDALVVKFDSSLHVLARKRYGGDITDIFYDVATDTSGNIICAGYTQSEGDSSWVAVVVKFDSSLNVLARKVYGGAGSDYFYGVATDASDNIICAGYTNSEGTGMVNAVVVKFDSSLNVLARKRCGGRRYEHFYAVTTDTSGDIICVGRTDPEGAGNWNALVIKLPSTIPSGTFTGTVLSELTLADSTLTLADGTLTLMDSTLTLADSNLTLADSTLTLANSQLMQIRDTLTAN